MNNFNIIQSLISTTSNEEIDRICDSIVNNNYINIEELKNITNLKNVNNISYLVKYPYYKKNMELKNWYNQDIKFNYIEDWKDQKKINLIKLLIIFEYFDFETLKQTIGNQSKKTYQNGEIINDSSLALKIFFNNKLHSTNNEFNNFYLKLDIIREDILKLDNSEIIKSDNSEIIKSDDSDIKLDNSEIIKSDNSDIKLDNSEIKSDNSDIKLDDSDIKLDNSEIIKSDDSDIKLDNSEIIKSDNSDNSDIKLNNSEIKSDDSDIKLDDSDIKLDNSDIKLDDSEIIKLDNSERIKNITKQMIELIHCDIVCREKYNKNELEQYSLKISDIIDTRLKEEIFFQLNNKIKFKNLVNENGHKSLKCILFVSWDETKKNYYWLTQLITFINNNNVECKEYLINECGVPPFDLIDNVTNDKTIKTANNKIKANIIKIVAKNIGLNMKNINQIINFIFSIGAYFKHGTYYKWYNKEYKYIKLFENYKNKLFSENLLELAVQLQNIELAVQLQNIELEPINNLLLLMNDYNSCITSLR